MIRVKKLIGSFGTVLIGLVVASIAVAVTYVISPSTFKMFGGRYSPLEVTPNVVRLGPHHRDEVIPATFTVKNFSSESVEILGVNSGCGCYFALGNFPFAIGAHDQRHIEMSVHVGAPGSDGKFVREAKIITGSNDRLDSLVIEVTVVE